jgi:hypothetical protein
LEAFSAEHWPALRRTEGNRCFLAALRAGSFRFRSDLSAAPSATAFSTLRFTCFAAFWLVLKSLVGEKHLFAGRKHKLGATFRALQDLIVEFHNPLPLGPQRAAGTEISRTMGLIEQIDLYSGVAGHGSLGPVGEDYERNPNFSA